MLFGTQESPVAGQLIVSISARFSVSYFVDGRTNSGTLTAGVRIY